MGGAGWMWEEEEVENGGWNREEWRRDGSTIAYGGLISPCSYPSHPVIVAPSKSNGASSSTTHATWLSVKHTKVLNIYTSILHVSCSVYAPVYYTKCSVYAPVYSKVAEVCYTDLIQLCQNRVGEILIFRKVKLDTKVLFTERKR